MSNPSFQRTAASGASMRRAIRYIVLGGVIAGFLDITYAVTFHGLSGIPPIRILQSIASGLLGRSSFDGGLATASLGLLLHFGIAIGASATFYAASLRRPWLVEHPVVSGMVFGSCLYVVMNFVVLPLSAVPFKPTFHALAVATDLCSHLFFVGVPIALCARAAFGHQRTGGVLATSGMTSR